MANDFGLSSVTQTSNRLADPARPGVRDTVVEKPTLGLSPAVGEAVFETVVAAMWSDGELSTSEVDRGRAVARALDVKPSRGGSAFAAIAQGSLPFDEIAFAQLGPAQRRLAFAASEWATVSGDEACERQTQFLRGLQLRLRLTDDEAVALRDLASSASIAETDARAAFTALAQRLLAVVRA